MLQILYYIVFSFSVSFNVIRVKNELTLILYFSKLVCVKVITLRPLGYERVHLPDTPIHLQEDDVLFF